MGILLFCKTVMMEFSWWNWYLVFDLLLILVIAIRGEVLQPNFRQLNAEGFIYLTLKCSLTVPL